ncbi:Por secretion system C-terminal sorting domain-containing protein [Hymenobacter gelipurpurascens]|uniref:Por secretion system C-terminal sorting domain-containing protein n=1 Tax=Hymenobacter gelipurpurascens TaxID=89968 RepID=A0A212UAH4_9BACT|nr:S8 family serine peptidase [Hymenobacter gelipurpurascens]SNC75257.1 Por secretion system C-terminal sorting domain-containing protein [Hymenobacter gelipurpurascens]
MSAAFPACRAFRRILVAVVCSIAVSSWPGISKAQTTPTPPISRRIAPGMLAGRAPHTVRVSVSDAAAFRQWLAREKPEATVTAEPHHPALLRVQGASPSVLAACPWITFVDKASRQAHDEIRLSGSDFGLNKVSPVHSRYPSLTGSGLAVSIKENPLDIQDIDFKGRLLNPDPKAAMQSSHSTIMATLIAGGGNSSPDGKGAAWQARIAQSDYSNLLPDDGAVLAQQGVTVQNHSYGVGIENYYGLEAQAYDEQTRQYPALLHVFSSGNSGNQTSSSGPYSGLAAVANLTGQFKMAKNVLLVGATDALGQVSPLSSRGPAYDGRIKPELVAYGDGGSSEAAALVSGISLLVQQAYREKQGSVPPAALVKAVLLNSADDAGRPAVDFESGYGQADALGAVQTMLENRFMQGSVGQGQEQVLQITVPAGTQHLKVTLAWADPAAAANASRALLNDLDLTLVRPTDGQRWLPWTLSSYAHPDSLRLPARRRPDHLNNAEQITLDVPGPGIYELHVGGNQVPQGPQSFSVAYEFGQLFSWTQPTSARNLPAASIALLRWQWAGPATAARLEYRPIGQRQWQVLSPSIDLAKQYFRWSTPDTTAPMQVRLLTGAASYESDTFFVARPLALQVGYNCPEETLLTWARVPGATHYQVYVLGETQLEPFRTLPDTVLFLTPGEVARGYYAVAPVVQGLVGERGSTPNIRQEAYGCYIRSFIPQQLVSDTVRLQLQLGTTFRLKTTQLQRREADGTFRTVQTVPAALAQTLTDASPVPGRAEYRAKLEADGGRVYYSAVEEVFFVRPNDVLVYPVPAAQGAPLTVVGPKDKALRVRVFDMLGRLRGEVKADGTINSVVLPILGKGTFLLRISAGNGPEQTRRILVL